MATQTLYRKANTSLADATASLLKRFPKADSISLSKKTATADEAVAAGAKIGELVYEATVVVAEFPPADDGAGDEGAEEAPAPKEEKPESKDEESSEGDTPDFGSKEEGGAEGDVPEKLTGEDLTNDLLQKILDAVSGGAALGGPDAGPGLDAGLPDIGAPGQGEGLPAPGGPGGALPPPVHEKSPIGAGAFAHYNASAKEINVVRSTAGEIGNKAMIAEAAQVYPTHKVARIQRTGSAVINGVETNLPEKGIALVTLIAK